jgi:ubiquinone/menaquinone biosynthesis C-methylase UbiE
MDSSNVEMPACSLNTKPDSLFERVSWFYALCREYLFRDHTEEISRSLFPPAGPETGNRLLELGCGPGFYACRLSEKYPNLRTTGVDLSHALIERAKSRAAARQLSNCSFQHADAHSLPYPSASVDSIVVSRLFLIVPDKEGIVREIFRVLKPTGRCFIAEPTSGFRTRLPLAVRWLLARLTTSPAGKYREPQQADVMSRSDFAALVRSQPWDSVDLEYDGWYQYAVCTRGLADLLHPQQATSNAVTAEPQHSPGTRRDPASLTHA